ncbi:MAG: UDP-N-acetylglucosamine--dolichyl-phosphate N-acetylglucosaminephosphotransferase [Thermoproteota archaeon]
MTFTIALTWASLSFLLTYFLMPLGIKLLKSKGWTGVDVHKPVRVECAESGGLVILLTLSVSFILMLLTGYLDRAGIGACLTIVSAGLVGFLDDMFTLRQRNKVLLMMLAGLPLAIFYTGAGSIRLPLVGTIEFGAFYYMLMIILAVNVASNLTNMLAGFNGLEAGFASVACGFLSIVSLARGEWTAAFISLASLGALLAFLRYNWYPARVFPGDSGTLMFGTIIASTAVLSGAEFLAVSLMIPAIFDFVLKMQHGKPFAQRRLYGDTKVNEAGILSPPGYAAFSHAFMKVAPTSERRLVLLILLSETLMGVLALILMIFLGGW